MAQSHKSRKPAKHQQEQKTPLLFCRSINRPDPSGPRVNHQADRQKNSQSDYSGRCHHKYQTAFMLLGATSFFKRRGSDSNRRPSVVPNGRSIDTIASRKLRCQSDGRTIGPTELPRHRVQRKTGIEPVPPCLFGTAYLYNTSSAQSAVVESNHFPGLIRARGYRYNNSG